MTYHARAEKEAKSIANVLGVTPLVQDQATKDVVMGQLPSARLIHFACHGETDGKGLALACDSRTVVIARTLVTHPVNFPCGRNQAHGNII